jgi:hypothetical protein
MLPEVIEKENLPWFIKFNKPPPSFITLKGNLLIIKPTLKKEAGEHLIEIKLTDLYS